MNTMAGVRFDELSAPFGRASESGAAGADGGRSTLTVLRSHHTALQNGCRDSHPRYFRTIVS